LRLGGAEFGRQRFDVFDGFGRERLIPRAGRRWSSFVSGFTLTSRQTPIRYSGSHFLPKNFAPRI
jgi:hypothetical protein